MKEISKEMQDLLVDIIKKREKALKSGDHKMVDDDLLGMLLKSNLKEIKENKNNKCAGKCIEDVIEDCKLFYFAGKVTTANVLAWTMILLSIHQKWQVRVREEVWQVFGKNKPGCDGLSHLKIVSVSSPLRTSHNCFMHTRFKNYIST